MKFERGQFGIHFEAIARWAAKRRKTSIHKVMLDLKFIPPSSLDDDVLFFVEGRRTYLVVVAGQGDVFENFGGQGQKYLGNIFADEDCE